MDLVSHLRAFVAVAEASSFTRGADVCEVPQPVVSRRVAALEKHLGGVLLRRSSRTVELTDLGRTLLPHASELVARADHLVDLARAHATEVVVALPYETDARALVAARRAAENAGVALGFAEHSPDGRTDALASGRVVAAFIASPPDEAEMGAELGAGTTADALRGRRMHLDQLRRKDDRTRPGVLHIDAEDDVPWVRDPLLRAARDVGLRPDQIVVGATRTAALTSVHEHGDVVACTPAWAERHGLRWRALGGVTVRRSYALARPPGAGPVPGLDAAMPALARAVGLEVADAEHADVAGESG